MTTPKVHAYHLFQRWLTKRSMAASSIVLFPTQAMLDLVASHTQRTRSNWHVAHYGTRLDLFHPTDEVRPDRQEVLRLLNVSLYSDQKNFGTLMQAVQLLQQQEPGRYQLRLTAGFDRDWLGESAFFPNFRREQALFRQLNAKGVARM